MFKFIGREDKKYIRIGKNKFELKNLLELDIDEYFKFLIYVEKNDVLNLIRLITDIPENIIKLIDINSLFVDINWKELLDELKIKEITIENMNVGDFNTLIYFMDSSEEAKFKNMKIYLYTKYLVSNKLMKLYYKYVKNFDLFSKYNKIKDSKIKVGLILPYIIAFQKFRQQTIDGFPGVFKPVIDNGEKKETNNLQVNNIGLMELIYSEIYTTQKSASDIKKLLNENLYTFLNYYTWKITQIKKEIQEQKRNK